MMEQQSKPLEPEWTYPSVTYHHYVGHHSMYIIVAYDLPNNIIKYIDIKGGKPDPCETGYREAIQRLANIAFSKDASVEEVARSLRGITCVPEGNSVVGGYIRSPADYLAMCLSWTQERMDAEQRQEKETTDGDMANGV